MAHYEREKIMEQYSAAQRLMQMHRYDEAARYLKSCFEQCEVNGDTASCETLLGELAICYQKADRYDDSMQALFKLIDVVKHEGPTQRRAILHHNLGFLFEIRKDFAGAQEHFRWSSEIASEAGDKRGQGLSLAMLAQVQIADGQVDTGFATFVRAIATLQEVAAPELDHVIDHTRSIARKQNYAGLAELARSRIADMPTLSRLLSE